MEEKEIITITTEQLKQHRKENFKGIRYNGIFISQLDNHTPEDPRIAEHNFKYPYRIETFFVILCKRGRGKISINLNEYDIEDNTLIINIPNSIIQVQDLNEGQGSEAIVLGFDEKGHPREHNHFDIKRITPLFLALKEKPVIKLTESECNKLTSILQEISEEVTSSKEDAYLDDILQSYFSLFFYRMCSIMSRQIEINSKSENSVKSRNEEYFHKFIKVLSENYKRERNLSFYASQLCITPKYLTTLIKRVSGRSAAEWIDQYVTMEAKNLLRYSTMSIQEVAYHLNFPNQSFFGKYFKHQTGYSPSAYKLLK